MDDIRKILSEYALDAIGVMFIGSKLGVLQGDFLFIVIYLSS